VGGAREQAGPPEILGQERREGQVSSDDQDSRPAQLADEGAPANLTRDEPLGFELTEDLADRQWGDAEVGGELAVRGETDAGRPIATSDPVAQGRVDPAGAWAQTVDHACSPSVC
jgi:hypothetical protein